MRIGLFFGTFDPIHVAHFEIANNLIKHSILEKVWFVVTPHNPFKINQTISSRDHRIAMVKLAIKNFSYFHASDIEFQLESPQYTARTLRYIKKHHPNENFFIIMGSDNYENLQNWRDSNFILHNFKICVYKRAKKWDTDSKNIIKIPGEHINISSSATRENIVSSKKYLHEDVFNYALDYGLYT